MPFHSLHENPLDYIIHAGARLITVLIDLYNTKIDYSSTVLGYRRCAKSRFTNIGLVRHAAAMQRVARVSTIHASMATTRVRSCDANRQVAVARRFKTKAFCQRLPRSYSTPWSCTPYRRRSRPE